MQSKLLYRIFLYILTRIGTLAFWWSVVFIIAGIITSIVVIVVGIVVIIVVGISMRCIITGTSTTNIRSLFCCCRRIRQWETTAAPGGFFVFLEYGPLPLSPVPRLQTHPPSGRKQRWILLESPCAVCRMHFVVFVMDGSWVPTGEWRKCNWWDARLIAPSRVGERSGGNSEDVFVFIIFGFGFRFRDGGGDNDFALWSEERVYQLFA